MSGYLIASCWPSPWRALHVTGGPIKFEGKQHMIDRKKLSVHLSRPYLTLAAVTTLVFSTAGFVRADLITSLGTGILDAGNGSVIVSGNGITSGCINWYNSGPAPTICPDTGGTGTLTVQGGSTAPFTPGQTGTIQDLSFETTYPLVDFMVVNKLGGVPLQFDLADIRFNGGTAIGNCAAGANDPGATCTPANSPFQLTNGLIDPGTGVVDTVSVSFTVDAYGYKNSSGTDYNDADTYVGTFTTQQAIQDATIASILGTIGGGGALSASWSASFTPETSLGSSSPVPEPPPFILMGAGLMVVGLFRRNARKA
jgi:hypothetical protein